MDTHGGYLWAGMWVVVPKGMMGHRNEAWGGTGGRCGSGLGHDVYGKIQSNNQT